MQTALVWRLAQCNSRPSRAVFYRAELCASARRMVAQAMSAFKYDAERAQCALRFAADEPFFAGHFPQHPLVPGVMLVAAAVRLAGLWRRRDSKLNTIVDSRFYDEVRPNDEVLLSMTETQGVYVVEVKRGEKMCAVMTLTVEDAT